MIRSPIRFLCFLSGNRKSKIQNLKWVAVAVAVFASALARAGEAPRWQTEWEQTVAAAKKEGEISFYGSQGYEKVFEVFQKKYPEIKVKSNTTRRGSEHGQAVMTERRAGQYLVDLFINGVVTPIQVFLKANILEPIRPQLILPEVVDEAKWWEGKHHYADPEGKYILSFRETFMAARTPTTRNSSTLRNSSLTGIFSIRNGKARLSPTMSAV